MPWFVNGQTDLAGQVDRCGKPRALPRGICKLGTLMKLTMVGLNRKESISRVPCRNLAVSQQMVRTSSARGQE